MDIFTKNLLYEFKALSVFEKELAEEISGQTFGLTNEAFILEEQINSHLKEDEEKDYKRLLLMRIELLKNFSANIEKLEEKTKADILTYEKWKLKFGWRNIPI